MLHRENDGVQVCQIVILFALAGIAVKFELLREIHCHKGVSTRCIECMIKTTVRTFGLSRKVVPLCEACVSEPSERAVAASRTVPRVLDA